MPWKAFKRNSKWKVYQIDEDGQPVGDALGTHDSEEQARKQVAALNANTQESTHRVGHLRELVDLTEATLNMDTHTIMGARLIKTGWSKNGRYYGDGVLAQAAPLWEGAKAYADHPSRQDTKNRPERSVRDIVGVYENPRHENGATLADFRVLGEAQSWLWPLIEESAKGQRNIVGLSINALGRTVKGEAEGQKGIIVEAITHANSVDVVTEPAAGGGFDHLLMADDGWTAAVLETMALDELREARPDLIAALQKEWKTPRDSKALVAAREEKDRLAGQLAEAQQAEVKKDEEIRTLQAALKAAQVDRLLMQAKLPEEWKQSLRGELLEAEESRWVELLEREMKKAQAVKSRRPVKVTGAGRLMPDPTLSAPASNPVASSLGLREVARDNETPQEFMERIRRKQNNG